MIKTVLSLAMLLLFSVPLFAGEPGPTHISYLKLDQENAATLSGDRPGPVQEKRDEQLDLLTAEFARFAREKVGEMNQNLIVSRERMEIRKEADGSYSAVFHKIDDTSMSCEVSRSQSRSVPYVAVLSYKEQVFAASCATPEQCRQGFFNPVGFIPNRHIFSYSNGSWN